MTVPPAAQPGTGPAALPLAVAILLFVAVHACYLVSASHGHVEWCFPYLEGCTTISKAARVEPEVFIYRVMVTASAVLMIPFWRITGTFHDLLGDAERSAARRAFVVLGVLAAVLLAVNAGIIGSDIDWVRRLRRLCVLGFFFGVFGAVALATLSLARVGAGIAALRGPLRAKGVLTVLMPVLGAFNYIVLPLVPALEVYEDEIQSAIEWNWVAMLCAFFACSAVAWRRVRLEARWTASP